MYLKRAVNVAYLVRWSLASPERENVHTNEGLVEVFSLEMSESEVDEGYLFF